MSYLGAVNLIKSISETVNPTGLFQHGRRWQASLNFSENDKQIYLYPIRKISSLSNHYYETWSIVMGFYFQDAPDSTPLQQQAIVNEADIMSTEFENLIKESEGTDCSDFNSEPSYRQMAGTYTGYILSFTLNTTTDLCAL